MLGCVCVCVCEFFTVLGLRVLAPKGPCFLYPVNSINPIWALFYMYDRAFRSRFRGFRAREEPE